MLQVAFIRNNPQLVKERLAVRNFVQPELVDEIIVLDEEVKILKKKVEDAQMQINSRSGEIQKLIKNNQQEEISKVREEVTLLKAILNKEKPEL